MKRPVKPAVYEKTFPVPVARVWRALTEPEQIVKWCGEDAMFHVTDIQHELRPGASVSLAASNTGKFADDVQGGRKFVAAGTCVEVKPLRSLAYTRLYANSVPIAEETLIRYELVEQGGVTRVRVIHSGFESNEGRDLHEQGWQRVLGYLDNYLKPVSKTEFQRAA